MFDEYRRPLKMWLSGRPLVANERNHDYEYICGEGSTPDYAFADFPTYQYEKEEIISEKEE